MYNVFLDKEKKEVCFVINGTSVEFKNWEELNEAVLSLKLGGNKIFGPEISYDNRREMP